MKLFKVILQFRIGNDAYSDNGPLNVLAPDAETAIQAATAYEKARDKKQLGRGEKVEYRLGSVVVIDGVDVIARKIRR